MVAERDRPLTLGRPHPAEDRLQPNAVLIRGPDLNRFVRVLGRFLGNDRGQLFLNASRSSGVAEAGWRGRGFCTDQLIAFRASQPRWGRTAASPSSPAIQAATLGPVHRPPSDGGVASRSGNRARSSGRSTLGALPLRRRKSPRASGPWALYRARSCSIQRGPKLVTAATSAIVCPRANNQITWKCRVAVGSRADRSLASRSSTLRCSATRAMARLRDSWRTSLPASHQPRNPQSESIARTPYEKIRPHHLERKALLYVRQSSAHQVLHNRESRALQYAMRDRLTVLGWSAIEVIDEDLGRSAAGSVQRAGFERMVAEVC